MKLAFVIALLFALTSCVSSGFVAGGPTTFDHSNALDASSGQSLAVGVLSHPDPVTGVIGEASLAYDRSSFSTVGIDGNTDRLALRLGVRYPFGEFWGLRPYFGGGFSPQYLRVRDSAGESVHDSVIAGYGTAGIDVPIGHDWSIGLSYLRTFGANFDLGDAKNQDFDSSTVALVLGWSF